MIELFNKVNNTYKTGKLYRWCIRLQDYSFICKYIPGQQNIVADYLSRFTPEIKNNELNALHQTYLDDIYRQHILTYLQQQNDLHPIHVIPKCICGRILRKDLCSNYYNTDAICDRFLPGYNTKL